MNRRFSRARGWYAPEVRAARLGVFVAQVRGIGASALAWLVLLLAAAVAAGSADAAGTAGGSEGTEASSSLFDQPELSAVSGLVATATKSACTPEFGSFSTGHWPPACWRPYGPSSPFNMPIPGNPTLAPESATIVKYFKRRHWAFQNEGGKFVIHAHGSRPVYWAQSSDPLIKVNCSGGYPCQPGTKLRIPAGAQPEDEWDEHMTVVEQAEGLEYDFWRTSKPEKGELTTSSEGSIPIGANSGTGLGGVAEAADLGLLGGLIRAPELEAGKIEHALALVVPCVRSSDVYPSPSSGGGDTLCGRGTAGPHFGNLIQLDMSEAEIAATGAPSWQQTIMKALAKYGAYVVDTSGRREHEMDLVKEDDQSFTSFGYAGEMSSYVQSHGGTDQLVGVPIEVSKLRVINPCVPQGTC